MCTCGCEQIAKSIDSFTGRLVPELLHRSQDSNVLAQQFRYEIVKLCITLYHREKDPLLEIEVVANLRIELPDDVARQADDVLSRSVAAERPACEHAQAERVLMFLRERNQPGITKHDTSIPRSGLSGR